MDDSSRLLRMALKGNALFSLLSGLAMVFFSGRITAFIGISPAVYLTLIGAGLIVFALLVWMLSRLPEIRKHLVWLVILLDLLWVAGSAVLLLAGIFTPGGNWTVSLLAVVVFGFAVAQYIGLRRLQV